MIRFGWSMASELLKRVKLKKIPQCILNVKLTSMPRLHKITSSRSRIVSPFLLSNLIKYIKYVNQFRWIVEILQINSFR